MFNVFNIELVKVSNKHQELDSNSGKQFQALPCSIGELKAVGFLPPPPNSQLCDYN